MNQKRILFFLLSCMVAAAQGHSQEEKPAKPATAAPVAVKDTLAPIFNLLNAPLTENQDYIANVYFQEALKAFEAKKYEEAALHIRIGIQDLLRETPKQHHKIKNFLVEQRVGELTALSLQIEAGLVSNRAVLQNLFAQTLESVAQRYYEHINLLNGVHPEAIANRLLCMSVYLRQSEEYRANAAEKAALLRASDDAAGLGADIRDMKAEGQLLAPEIKTRLHQLMTALREMRLDE
jgi:hypothetical protein